MLHGGHTLKCNDEIKFKQPEFAAGRQQQARTVAACLATDLRFELDAATVCDALLVSLSANVLYRRQLAETIGGAKELARDEIVASKRRWRRRRETAATLLELAGRDWACIEE